MKNKLLISSVVIVLFLIVVFILYNTNRALRVENSRIQANFNSMSDSLRITYDELGRKTTEVQTLRLTKAEFENLLVGVSSQIGILKKELERSDVKIRNLISAVASISTTTGQGQTQIIYIPKDSSRVLEVNDDILYFKAQWQRPDVVAWTYKIIQEVIYWTEMKPSQRKPNGKQRNRLAIWLFPKKTPQTFLKSTNKNTEIKAVQVEIQ